jgi:hypothetical protein
VSILPLLMWGPQCEVSILPLLMWGPHVSFVPLSSSLWFAGRCSLRSLVEPACARTVATRKLSGHAACASPRKEAGVQRLGTSSSPCARDAA